jgi:HEAT repeat protein
LGNSVSSYISPLLRDSDPTVALSATWLMTLYDPNRGLKEFVPKLSDPNREMAILAAGALASTGCYGTPLLIQSFHEAADPYIKMNLALGLINQRTEIIPACQTLVQGLLQDEGRWMWEENGIFRAIAPSKIKHGDSLITSPDSVNQLVRLELLNTLAIMKEPMAQEGIKKFLQQRKWGVSGIAAALLLSEGDESALDIVKNLLSDQDENIRVQAALVLALWGRDESALTVLREAYPHAPREMKEKILEGIGRVGAMSSIPFLVETFNDPFQTLRVIAAAACLECLNQ